MKLNNITSLHHTASIDHKDIVWDFIVEDLENAYSLAAGISRIAMFVNDCLVQVEHKSGTNFLTVISEFPEGYSEKHDAARNEVIHAIIDPINEAKEYDVHGEVFDMTDKRHKKIQFYHTNTSDLKCFYKFDYEGDHQEGSFFLDMLDCGVYEGIHEGIAGQDGVPDEYVFSYLTEADYLKLGHGYEVHVRLNASSGELEITETTIYVSRVVHHVSNGEVHYALENFETIDGEISIINTSNNKIVV